MEVLKEVARDRLVIMVTHNPELAQGYATRIIRVKDGRVIGDTMPVTPGELPPPGPPPRGTKLGFSTALNLSLHNLMTKKGRTILTSFAGAIGIIGIALILALSNGVNDYISDIEHDMLGVYPIQLEKETFDLSGMMEASESPSPQREEHDLDAIYSRNIVGDTVTASETMLKENDLGLFKTYLEQNEGAIAQNISAVEYGYDITPQVFRMEGEEVIQVSPARLTTDSGTVGGGTSSVWSQLVNDQALRESQYELVEGQWPSAHDQAALVINGRNEISDYNLYTLGLMDLDRMEAIVEAAEEGEPYEDPQVHFSYSDIIGRTYQVFAPSQLFAKGDKEGVWIDKTKDEDHWKEIFDEGLTVTITCVLRATEDADISSGVAYDGRLTQHLMALTAESQAVKDQLADPKTNILTGEAFEAEEEDPKAEETAAVSQTASVSTLRADQPYTLSLLTVTETPPQEEEPPAEEEVPPEDELPPQEESPETPPEEEEPPAEEPVLFTVTFINYDGGVLAPETQYESGAPITLLPQQNPVRAPTAAACYVFIGWWSSADMTFYRTSELPPVTKDVTYNAVYYEQPLAPGGGTSGFPGLGGFDWGSLSGSMSAALSQNQLAVMMAQMSDQTPDTYEEVLSLLGYTTPDTPEEIAIYPTDFDGKEAVEAFIQDYNDQTEREEDQVTYTDIIGALTSSITSIVDTISYVLIAFVAISLVVSSIMIAIITYISVLERTKEIGVLRALGASKRDVSKIFNAETVIEGFLSGLFGILVTLLLCIPINAIVYHLVEVENIAVLPMEYSLILIAISVILTLIAGFIPSRMAAKKDPVTALRTE
ncbi:MAG: FtsX-like permease family protein, partial [Ruminiclostridium sp.]|nr:FtsX-like permease family protein [Ruminiclostridium sp.]